MHYKGAEIHLDHLQRFPGPRSWTEGWAARKGRGDGRDGLREESAWKGWKKENDGRWKRWKIGQNMQEIQHEKGEVGRENKEKR